MEHKAQLLTLPQFQNQASYSLQSQNDYFLLIKEEQ